MEGTLFTMMILGIFIILGIISIILGMIYLINEIKDTFGFIIDLLENMFKVINTIVTKILGLGDTIAGLEKQLNAIIKHLGIGDEFLNITNKVDDAAKDAGNKIDDTATDIGNTTADAAKDVGKSTTSTANKVGKKLGF